MSSPLDARIRNLAREEASVLINGSPVMNDVQRDFGPHEALRQEVAELRATVEQLTARLDELEKPKPTPRRTARKETDE